MKAVGGNVRDNVIAALQQVQQQLGVPAATPVMGRLVGNKSSNDWADDVTVDVSAVLERWVRAKSVHEQVDAELDQAKSEVVQAIMPIFAAQMYRRKSKPSNPVIEISMGGDVQHRYQIWMTSVFTTHFKKSTSDTHTPMAYVQDFVDAGLTVQAATDLVANELRLIRHQGVRPISDLLTGSFDKSGNWMDSSEIERRAAAKIDAWLHWGGESPTPEPLTDVERLAAMVVKNVVVIRPGLLDRIHQYARDGKDIERIFTLLRPSIFPTRLDFAVTDDDVAKKLKRIRYSAEILA